MKFCAFRDGLKCRLKCRSNPNNPQMAFSKSVIPYGFKTLVETLGKSILFEQPADIHKFASVYFKELLEFRDVNPTLDLKELVRLFYTNKVITADTVERTQSLSDSEEVAFQIETVSSNMLAPIDQKAYSLNNTPMEDVSVLQEDLTPSLLMTKTNSDKSNMVSKKISEMVEEEEPSFVYIYTNICSVNQDESGFAYIYTNTSSINQADESVSIEHEPTQHKVGTGPIKQAFPATYKDASEPEFNCIPALAQVQKSKVDDGTVRQAAVHKTQPASRKSESVLEASSAHRTLSTGTVMYQKGASMAHKALPVHAELFPTHTEPTSALCSEASVLDNYRQLLMALGRVSYPGRATTTDRELCQKDSPMYMVAMTPGDHKKPEKCNSELCPVLKNRKAKETLGNFMYTKATDVNEKDGKKMENMKEPGVNEAGSETGDMDSVSFSSQSEKILNQQTSDSENEGSVPVTYHSYNHIPNSQLDLQLLHSETQQEALNILTEIFQKVYIRLGELEFQMQDLVNRFENLNSTVNEIHSAMNIKSSGDSFCADTFERYENYFRSSL
ncbi:hypothetical protein scyTo_0004600 [Scyliorhinus torazame]|uniref:RIIa domain-containing protein n=1 Tax=Scyliorhinus torazame TaxID=75743 RepID=A0A401NU26_SCYTO|nr:hypothetical protein [Scyliorhinus torazame]